MDDKISRVFIEVTVDINPFTFRLIKNNRKEFQDDEMIQQLLDHAEWRGQKFGYVSSAFSDEYRNEDVMKRAQIHLKYSQKMMSEFYGVSVQAIDQVFVL